MVCVKVIDRILTSVVWYWLRESISKSLRNRFSAVDLLNREWKVSVYIPHAWALNSTVFRQPVYLCSMFAIRIVKGVLSGTGSDVWIERVDVDVERRTGCVNL